MTTFRELIREKFFLVIIFVSVLLIGLSLLLGQLSFNESQKILADLGLVAVQWSSLGLSLFIGSYMISREVERQTCLMLLARPISRTEFILGKVLGTFFLISLVDLLLPLALLALLGNWTWFIPMYGIVASLWLEALVILSLVTVLSVFLRPVLVVMAGLVIYFGGSWLEDMAFVAKKSQDVGLQMASSFFKWILPNFYRFNWKSYFFLEQGMTGQEFGFLFLHYVPWIGLLLVLAVVFFRRKDIV